jgi:hypothetical protein
MSDTPAHVARLQREMLMCRSGIERMRMGASMFATARRLMRASLGDPTGTDDGVEMRVQLFLRTYAQDFDPTVRDRIVARLKLWPGKKAG